MSASLSSAIGARKRWYRDSAPSRSKPATSRSRSSGRTGRTTTREPSRKATVGPGVDRHGS